MIEDTNDLQAQDAGEDVQGHGVTSRRVALQDEDAAAPARSPKIASAIEEDVQGHGVASRRVTLQDDDAAAPARAPRIASAVDEDDDVQGHVRS